MAPRPTWTQIKDGSKVLVEGVALASTVLDAVTKDERLSKTVKNLVDRVRETRLTPDPIKRLEQQLDLIDSACAELAQAEQEHDDIDDAEKIRTWQRQATMLRTKIPLVQAQVGNQRRTSIRDLRSRTATLLAAVIRHGLESEEDAEPVALVDERSSKSVRRSFPWIRKR